MTKVVQVVLEEELLAALDTWRAKQGLNRSELVREACRHFLRWMEGEEAERAYEEGYRRVPEETGVGEAQVALLGDVLDQEGR